jgi:hypothetical protein
MNWWRGRPGSANRLLKDASVCSRIAELKQLACNNTTQKFLELAITEWDQRLTAIRDRWDGLREAIVARAVHDYKRMMATGVVCHEGEVREREE